MALQPLGDLHALPIVFNLQEAAATTFHGWPSEARRVHSPTLPQRPHERAHGLDSQSPLIPLGIYHPRARPRRMRGRAQSGPRTYLRLPLGLRLRARHQRGRTPRAHRQRHPAQARPGGPRGDDARSGDAGVDAARCGRALCACDTSGAGRRRRHLEEWIRDNQHAVVSAAHSGTEGQPHGHHTRACPSGRADRVPCLQQGASWQERSAELGLGTCGAVLVDCRVASEWRRCDDLSSFNAVPSQSSWCIPIANGAATDLAISPHPPAPCGLLTSGLPTQEVATPVPGIKARLASAALAAAVALSSQPGALQRRRAAGCSRGCHASSGHIRVHPFANPPSQRRPESLVACGANAIHVIGDVSLTPLGEPPDCVCCASHSHKLRRMDRSARRTRRSS